MTCKQEFLVLENGESLLPCRVAASFPSWRAPSFILPGPLLIPANPSSNKRSLYLLAVCLSSAPLVFTSLQLDARWGLRGYGACSRAISDSRPLLSASGRADGGGIGWEGRDRLLYNVFPECPRLTSEFPISRTILDFGADVPGTCLPTHDSTALTLPRILPLKRITKFTDALFNCIVTHPQRSNNRLPPKTRYKLGSSALLAEGISQLECLHPMGFHM